MTNLPPVCLQEPMFFPGKPEKKPLRGIWESAVQIMYLSNALKGPPKSPQGGLGSIIPGRRFALPRADITWAFSPKKVVVIFKTSTNLNNMLVSLPR